MIDITPDPEWELAPFNESGHAQEATPERCLQWQSTILTGRVNT